VVDMTENIKIGDEIARHQGVTLWKLEENEVGDWYCVIEDEEIDFFDVYFNNDGCATIITEGFNNIVLDVNAIKKLGRMLKLAERLLKFKYDNNLDDTPLYELKKLYSKT
tara:strand:+ start:1718 stop:2047 length:330 start_codon:yes stop_codon:yes gene_type:complete